MKYLALITIAAFCLVSVIASFKNEWLVFIYRIEEGDKFAHFAGAILLSAVLVHFFSLNRISLRGPLLKGVALASALVMIEEAIQVLIPSRHFSWVDLGWSLSGVIAGGIISIPMLRKALN